MQNTSLDFMVDGIWTLAVESVVDTSRPSTQFELSCSGWRKVHAARIRVHGGSNDLKLAVLTYQSTAPSLIRRIMSRSNSSKSSMSTATENRNDITSLNHGADDESEQLSPCLRMEADGTLPQPEGTAGRRLTILSMDGGGVRGVIPSVWLEYLESELQKLDGEGARIADYFDVIAGTSTGGLIAAMLTAPDANQRPMFTAQQVTKFYIDEAATIFPPSGTLSAIKSFFGPKYKATPLKNLLVEYFNDLKIGDALTDVLITSFDVKTQQPVFFDKQVAKKSERFNAPYVDVCLGTSAAPTYLPAHHFVVPDKDSGPGKTHEYNLIDGGIAANNPTQVAILHAVKDLMIGECPHKGRIPHFEGYKDLLVLSLGTGDQTVSYEAKDMAGWGTLTWVLKDGKQPIIQMLQNSSAYLVDFDVAIRFQIDNVERNYLRLETKDIKGDMERLDSSDPKNMQALVDVAKKLLGQHAKYRNAVNGELVDKDYVGTNQQALSCFAKWLSEEKKGRHRLENPIPAQPDLAAAAYVYSVD
ncbi:hypothetical protein R1flu_009216 [Riccia fluitans]|uniref:Patatin n=1 Tax=Riccia fluitans TaxID=41844 RepID=A0ABD1Z3Z1_9MARC